MVITSKDNEPIDGLLDGPPSYDSLASAASRPTGDRKRPTPPWPPASSTAGPSRPPIPSPGSAGGSGSGSGSGNSAAWSLLSGEYWKKRTEEEEIRRTVRDLLHDVIHNLSEPASLDVLHSAYVACAQRGISFPLLSQEPIESHPPIYWAVLTLSPAAKALPGGSLSSNPPAEGWPALDLLSAFPLSEKTQREATAACVLGDDNALFQYLQMSEAFAPQGLAESITARSREGEEGQGRSAVDRVEVEHVADGRAGHFKIKVKIRDWLRRMRMYKKVVVRWIARGRAWQLTFGIADHSHSLSSGTWYCSIHLMRNTGSNTAALSASITLGTPSPPPDNTLLPGSGEAQEGRGKTVTLKLEKKSLEEDSDHGCYVKLSDTPGAASLEYEDSPYIGRDGSVCVEGEFVLEKS